MGLYIKGMEMPKNCYGCPFFKQMDYWNRNGEADILSKCKQTGAFTFESVDGYLPNCPLIPIQPHKLIDREQILDAIRLELAQANAVNDMDDYDEWMHIFDYVRKYPTIILEEPKEEEMK